MVNPSEIDISALPSVAFDQRHALPICQGIYFARDADGTVLYIGRAKNIQARWRAHHRTMRLSRIHCVTLSWLRFDGDADLLDVIERACIEYFSPVLNGVRGPGSVADDDIVEVRVSIPVWVYNLLIDRAQKERRPVKSQIEHELERWGWRELSDGKPTA